MTVRRWIGSAIVASAVLGSTACRQAEPSATATDFAGDGGSEIEYYNTADDMLTKVDKVVVGRVVRVVRGPQSAEFSTARVFVEDRRSKSQVEVGFVLSLPEAADQTFAELRTALPKADAVWMLRSVEKYLPGVYRVANTASIVEKAPDGTSQPAFYRSTAEQARAGVAPTEHRALIEELVKTRFDDLAARAEKLAKS